MTGMSLHHIDMIVYPNNKMDYATLKYGYLVAAFNPCIDTITHKIIGSWRSRMTHLATK